MVPSNGNNNNPVGPSRPGPIKPDEALEVWLTIKEVQVDDQATRPRFPVVLACRPARAGRPAGRIVPAFCPRRPVPYHNMRSCRCMCTCFWCGACTRVC